jgi:hypothetical protein
MEGKDFIHYVTSPVIGVITCPRTDIYVKKKNVKDFIEFIQPFGKRINQHATIDINMRQVLLDPCYLRFADYKALQVNQPKDFIKLPKPTDSLPALLTKNEIQKYREQVASI